MIDHEPTISFTSSLGGGVAGIAAFDSYSQHICRSIPAMPSYLAVSCRLQHRRREPIRQSTLHKCPQVGKTFPIQWVNRIARSQKIWTPQDSRKRHRRSSHQNSYFASSRLRPGLYHMVTGQARNPSSPTLRYFFDQSRNNSSYSCASRSSVSDRPNMVRKQRSRIRGKKNAIIQIYRHRPRWGQIICFDEMGPLQTIPRGGKAWGKRANLRPDRYKRNGTVQWFCAFNPHSGISIGKGFSTKSAESCRRFWLEHMLPSWPKGGIHLVMDNLSSHKKAFRELPARIRRRIHVYWTPTNSSWLNLIESYFATLQRTALHNTDYKTPLEIEQGLQRGIKYLNEKPRVYKWKKI